MVLCCLHCFQAKYGGSSSSSVGGVEQEQLMDLTADEDERKQVGSPWTGFNARKRRGIADSGVIASP